MTEVFFILTIVFVAYVVFSVVSDEKKNLQRQTEAEKNTDTVTPEVPVTPPKESTSTAKATKETKPATKATASAKSTAETSPKTESESLRNPKNGEVAKIPNNYRFSKRWIKEALVKEGLLDKIYKNNELNDEANVKIKQALADLQAMEKYKV